MFLKNLILTFFLLVFSFSTKAEDLRPVTIQCVTETANTYNLPQLLLAAVIWHEHGAVGLEKTNKNGTKDYGPMQINTKWIQDLHNRNIPISLSDIRNNGCINIKVGAAKLRYHIDQNKGNVWEGIADYHSKTKYHGNVYQSKIAKAIEKIASQRISWNSLLAEINPKA